MSCAHLLQSSSLFFLLLDTFLPLGQQLALVLLLLPQLLLLEELLAAERLRALLVLLLQPDEVAAQSRFSRHVDDGASRGAQMFFQDLLAVETDLISLVCWRVLPRLAFLF